ncbi:hypothetical protein [Anaerolinea sp.]|uniref:hypothetical protein n=1 Tax=Anaerolinea sp. TaxID=1872519 RepID=UPI002ACE3EF0|nr:hypothetical protein [Anaerolinea sp.]
MTNAPLSAPKPGEGALLWAVKIFSGVLILLILILHFLVNHYWAPNGLLSHAEVVAYYQNYPIVPIMEGFFLIFVVAHSLLGVRSILLDLRPSPRVLRGVDGVLILIGVTASVYGIWLLIRVTGWGG